MPAMKRKSSGEAGAGKRRRGKAEKAPPVEEEEEEDEEDEEEVHGARGRGKRHPPACQDESLEQDEDQEDQEDQEDEEEEDGEDEDEDEDEDGGEGSEGEKGVGGRDRGELPGLKRKAKGPLTLKSLGEFQQKVDRTGVVYISRVPPYMKPEKIRHLLGRHAEVGRVFLTPEDPAVRKKRKAMGGNKRQSYIDGWVEFLDKRKAKRVAKDLNTQPIGGRATSFYSADLWNLKYLSGFKWKHLTEKIAYDNTVRRQKLQAEIAQAKREKDFYLERVEQHKRLSNDKRKRAVGAKEGQKKEAGGQGGEVLRTFRQSESISAKAKAEEAPKKPNSALLSRIFGKSS